LTGPVSWKSFSAAPHRVFFFSGGLYSVLAVAMWTLQQYSLYAPLIFSTDSQAVTAAGPILWSVPFPKGHGMLMLYPLLAYYIFGFLLVTFPRWLETEEIPRSRYLGLWGLLLAGSYTMLAGLLLGKTVVLLGLGLTLAFYLAGMLTLGGVYLRTSQPRSQQTVMLTGMLMAQAGLAAGMVGVSTDSPGAYHAMLALGKYGFLLPLIFAVVYRMVPFFTSNVSPGLDLRRSRFGLQLFTGFSFLRLALELAVMPEYYWMADLGLLAVLLWEMAVWRFWRATYPPLLVVIYQALFWFVVSLTMYVFQSLALFAGWSSQPPFGLGPLHALVVGGFGTLLLGLSTRVTLGHSGRGLAASLPVSAMFQLWQLVPLSRVLPEIVGYWHPQLLMHGFWAGGGWVLVMGAWLPLVGHMLLRPRSDGRPG